MDRQRFAPAAADATRRRRLQWQLIVALRQRPREAPATRGAECGEGPHAFSSSIAGTDVMKTVVGSFDSFDEANEVARELIDEGYRDSDVSVVANNVRGGRAPAATAPVAGTAIVERPLPGDAAVVGEPVREGETSGAATGAVTGGVVGGAAGLAASLMGLAIPGIGPIIAAGPIVAMLTGAGVGAVAGGLIGSLTDMGVSRSDAEYYAEAVRRGGALVTVRAAADRAERAVEIMRDHGAIDIERRASQWRERGWTGFAENAAPYTADELDRDRDLYGVSDETTSARERAAEAARAARGARTY